MRHTLRIVLVSIGFLGAAYTWAAPKMEPGLWQITTKVELVGMPMQMPPITAKQCITKQDVENRDKALPKGEGNCNLENVKSVGNKTTWEMRCTEQGGAVTTGSGTILYESSTSYQGSMKMTRQEAGSPPMHMTQEYTARRIGNCK
jgi:hypothetical protein